jgi:hypothetical protein
MSSATRAQNRVRKKQPMKKTLLFSLAALLLMNNAVRAGETPSAKDAKVYFINIANGDTVKSPVKVQFGLSGMGIAPAGTEKENTGHHHVFIDRPALGKGEDGADELNANIISDEQHVHFGKGQTETTLDLKPGQHTLQMVLGDKDHIPHNPPLATEVITITVN